MTPKHPEPALSRLMHDRFGGCVALHRAAVAGVMYVGVYDPCDARMWMQTMSTSDEELRAVLMSMPARTVSGTRGRKWTDNPMMRAQGKDPEAMARSRRKGSANARASKARAKAAREYT